MKQTMKLRHQLLLLIFLISNISIYSQTQIGFDIDGENPGDQCGSAVAISGDGQIVAIGAEENANNGFGAGQVRVFMRTMEDWVQLGENIDGEMGNGVGSAISISDDGLRVAISGAEAEFNQGQVQIFEWNGTSWIQLGSDLLGDSNLNYFGRYICLSKDGTVVAVGSGNDDDSGSVRIFEYNGTDWAQLGADIKGEAEDDRSGRVSISRDGRVVAIGSTGNDENGLDSGHARVFELTDGTWIKRGLNILGESPNDRFGASISVSAEGDRVAVGGQLNDSNGADSGHALVFDWNGSDWEQVGDEIIGESADNNFGRSISLSSDGNRLAVGASTNGGNGSRSGHVRIFESGDTGWVQLGEDIDGESSGDFSGAAISLSSDGEYVVIGASFNNGNGNESGHARVFGELQGVSSSEQIVESEVLIYPNPVTSYLEIISKEEVSLSLFNSEGRLLTRSKKGKTRLDLSEIPQGIYFLEISTKNSHFTKKIIKR